MRQAWGTSNGWIMLGVVPSEKFKRTSKFKVKTAVQDAD